ncbi:hypothetical protein [Phaeospirillum tilakii]|uniref:PIN domain-containing protein n=1 Tax=Phaeospirillum tilakii TaxID=741673 RepID=A0ABW5C7S7_9PROT
MKSGSFTVLLDACVLYPAPLRDLLMQLAVADLFRPRWSDLIHEEWIGNLLGNRPDLDRRQLERVRDLMNAHSRDSVVTGFEALIPTISSAISSTWISPRCLPRSAPELAGVVWTEFGGF